MVEVIDLEETMPYKRPVSRADVVKETLENLIDMYDEQAKYQRKRKDFVASANDQQVVNMLRQALRNPDPEMGLHAAILNAMYVVYELKETQQVVIETLEDEAGK
jgi:DNA-binding ferritin-like protein